MSNTPTDAEIDEVTLDVLGYAALDKETNDTARMIARAVLAKWGSPQPVVREPLTLQQIAKAFAEAGLNPDDYPNDVMIEPLVRAIEAAHGIKGGQHG